MKSGAFGGHEKGITVRPGFWHDRNVGAIGFLILFIVLLIAWLASPAVPPPRLRAVLFFGTAEH